MGRGAGVGYAKARTTAEQIQFWAGEGIEFGAHSRTHADLTTLTLERLKEEVLGSATDMEGLLRAQVTSFAYPFGFYDEEVVECVRGAFDLAFGINPEERGINHLLPTRICCNGRWCRQRTGLFMLSCVRDWDIARFNKCGRDLEFVPGSSGRRVWWLGVLRPSENAFGLVERLSGGVRRSVG